MEKDDAFLHGFFTHIAELCFDKAKEHVEKERETVKSTAPSLWTSLIATLPQIAAAEKSYMEIGFLQNKNKGFLRKDNSLKANYEGIKNDIKKVKDSCKQYNNAIKSYCTSIMQFLSARISLIEFYEKVVAIGNDNLYTYGKLLNQITVIVEDNMFLIANISMTKIKAVFNLECEILQMLLAALMKLQKLEFIPAIMLINCAHTRHTVWGNKIQNRETWKLGFIKNTQLPLLFQWHSKFKACLASKYGMYFHDILSKQTGQTEMKSICSKLQSDNYNKMVTFQRKYDATAVLLITDIADNLDDLEYNYFPVIVSSPTISHSNLLVNTDTILQMIKNTACDSDKIIYKYYSSQTAIQNSSTYIYTPMETNIYLVIMFDGKKSEKDVYIANFIADIGLHLRCTKVFRSLKVQGK